MRNPGPTPGISHLRLTQLSFCRCYDLPVLPQPPYPGAVPPSVPGVRRARRPPNCPENRPMTAPWIVSPIALLCALCVSASALILIAPPRSPARGGWWRAVPPALGVLLLAFAAGAWLAGLPPVVWLAPAALVGLWAAGLLLTTA